MSETFTETTTKSWGSRILESIFGVLFGFVLVLAAAVLLFWNEGRAVQTERSLAEGGKVVIEVAPDSVDSANDGRLIYVNGTANATAPLVDSEFGVSTRALRLVRIAEMYQWQEEEHHETHKNLGGSETTETTYTYSKVWSDRTFDSSRFHRRENHANPPRKYDRRDLKAADATLGAFKLDDRVLDLLSARTVLRVEPETVEALKPRIPAAQLVDGKIYIGRSSENPEIGDYKIAYLMVPNGPVSVIGQQAGAGFGRYQTKAGDRLLMAVAGTESAAAMFKEAEQENRILTWVLRVVGILAIWLGAALVLRPLVVVADVVPFIGDILGAGAALVALIFAAVVAPVIIAVAWLVYRPLTAVVALAIGLAAAYGLHRLAATRSAARRAAVQPPTPSAAA